jgi:hypothetical protein
MCYVYMSGRSKSGRQDGTALKMQMKKQANLKSRSVELFNPSAYTGMYVQKFDSPLYYTRINDNYPLYNQHSITRKLNLKGKPAEVLANNVLMAPWNVAEVFPLQNRRRMLI